MPRSSEWSLPFRFYNQNIMYMSHLSHACYVLAYFILALITLITFGEVYKLLGAT